MAIELSKTYNPKEFEEKWYKYWTDNKLFSPRKGTKGETYTIVIPPPNVTAVLHMGHGLNNTIQDIIIRHKRMQGYETLWIPGTDHAGIATQNVVEKELAKEGKKREDFTREDFVKRVWETALRHQKSIIEQLKKIGCSADWDRNAFTFDEKRIRAVKRVFIDLYNEGLIYKSKYIVNWCPRCGTALSDDEVEYTDRDSHLWHIKYPVKDSDEYIVVATTRPETMLGDTAVAFNETDERYAHLKGKSFILPIVNREIPAIFDSFVSKEFGTGAVKVTPAHDPNDFDMGQRHKLDFINILNKDATMNENVPNKYRGMDSLECRKQVVKDLKELNLLVKIEDHKHSVGGCYRCKSTIEPRYSDQWFVKMSGMAKGALKVVQDGKIEYLPERWKKVYYNWLNNIRDWCISRQLWWGHRIPIYYCTKCGELHAAASTPKECKKCGNTEFTQDTDVLDTWFSSWLWPFSTLGWPEQNDDLKKFYPTATLVTGPDIIFFWVARMIMAGLKFMKDIPFRRVFFTGMVMDLKGRKMSKSLGNGIDPFDVIERHGADALRYTMIAIVSPNQNLKLGFPKNPNGKEIDSFEIGTKFANKIWNASRYILMNIPDNFKERDIATIQKDVFDAWILNQYYDTVKNVNNSLEKARFNDAALAMQQFFWHSYCDWYIELSKSKIFSDDEDKKNDILSLLLFLLRDFLKLLHPIMPFITEEIYQKLPNPKQSIMITSYPEYTDKYVDNNSVRIANKAFELIYLVRNIKWEMNIPIDKKVSIFINTSDKDLVKVVGSNKRDIKNLTNSTEITISNNIEKPTSSIVGANKFCEVFIPLDGLIDIEKELSRLQKELQKATIEYNKTTSKLSNDNFISRAPQDVIEKSKKRAEEDKARIEKLNKNINLLQDINK